MKVLHIDSDTDWRGGQRQAKLLIDGCIENDIETHLFTPLGSPLDQRSHEKAHRLHSSMRGARQIKAAILLKNYCHTHSIDVVDAHCSVGHGVAFWSKVFGLKSKVVVHRRVDYMPKSMLSGFKYKSHSIDHFVCISEFISKVMEKFGVSSSKLSTVRSAVTEPQFNDQMQRDARQSIRERHNVADGTPIILNTAALTPQKNHEVLIKAAQILHRKGEKFCLLICGDGEKFNEFDQMIKDFELTDSVFLLGFIKNIEEYLLGSDLFAISSRDEGLGTSILDAVLYGLPVIATQAGGIPEIIEPMQTGFGSPVGDSGAFAANLIQAMHGKELTERLSKQALEHVRNKFSVRSMVAGNIEVYKRLVKST